MNWVTSIVPSINSPAAPDTDTACNGLIVLDAGIDFSIEKEDMIIPLRSTRIKLFIRKVFDN
jgi:hypothetical protein